MLVPEWLTAILPHPKAPDVLVVNYTVKSYYLVKVLFLFVLNRGNVQIPGMMGHNHLHLLFYSQNARGTNVTWNGLQFPLQRLGARKI